MKIGALIPARIGSKRLPKKNIKMLGGKPLICWTIDTLLEADIFSDVTLCTESDEIADTARSYYGKREVRILKRPAEYADDNSPLALTKELYLRNRPELDWYGCFLPTFPFRSPEKFREIAQAIHSLYPWKIIGATNRRYCSFDFYYPVKGGVKRFFEIPPVYAPMALPVYNMANTKTKPEMWGRYGLSSEERTYLLQINDREAIDIDTKEDFKKAEHFAISKPIPRKTITHDLDNWLVIAPQNAKLEKIIEVVGDKRLNNLDKPILILKQCTPPMSHYKICEHNSRTYWLSHEAYQYLQDPTFTNTQNSNVCPKHYVHVSTVRFLRKTKKKEPGNFLFTSDVRGILYGHGTGFDEHSIISSDRIVNAEEFTQKGINIDYHEFNYE